MKSAWSSEEDAGSWRETTARWFSGQFDPAQATVEGGLLDYQPMDRVSLEKVAMRRSSQVYFTDKLERQFRIEQRRENRTPRLILCLFAILFYVSVPLWAALLFELPPSTAKLAVAASLLLLVPISLLAAVAQYSRAESEAAEILLICLFCAQIAVIESLRLDANLHDMRMGPMLTASTPICAFSMIAMSMYRRMALLGFYIGVLVVGQCLYGNTAARLSNIEWFEAILLVLLALIGSIFVRISERRAWASNNLLRVSATQDVLTGLANRRAFSSHAESHLRSAMRGNKICAFILIDLDHFKKINDRYGHPYGDGVLMEVGVCLQQFARRGGDICARVGGEEFGIFLYDCTLHGLKKRLQEIVDSICDLGIDHEDNTVGIVTISVGAVAVAVSGEIALSKIYRHADKLLYQAKSQGRNRLVFDTLLA